MSDRAVLSDLDRRLRAAFQRSDELFALLRPEELTERPISLRHPFLFYVGHLPAFAWNQVGRGVLGQGHLRRDFDVLFERGIDPASEAGARGVSIHRWPPLDEVLAYRDEARAAVLARIPEVLSQKGDVLCEKGRVLNIVIEHELMHHETLLYMVQEHAAGPRPRPAHLGGFADGVGRAAEPRFVPGGEVTIGVSFDAIDFGWDNEFGRLVERVRDVSLDSLPVRNKDYLDFLRGSGESSRAALTPRAWVERGHDIFVKTVFGPVPFALAEGWPVQVSGVQARLYCERHGGRLPTEAELTRAAEGAGQSNLGFRCWSPVPTGSHAEAASVFGVEELIGNGWEWTSTAFGPLPGFTPYARTYPGYSADFFDDEHDVVFGASWATDEALARPSFRNWYRRDYPYVFSSFRVAREG